MNNPHEPSNFPGPPALGEKIRIAFLGPEGTFTEQAVWQVAPAGSELLPLASVGQALEAVRQRRADRAVVPIENSIEGGVNATIDALSSDGSLVIVSEMLVPVNFVLAARPGTRKEDIQFIGTHPHAWAQCRNWVDATLPGTVHVPTTSTAAAPQLLGTLPPGQVESPFQAVLSNRISAERYGLEILFEDVADNPGAVTRFIMVSLPGPIPPRTGADKTTIQVRLPHDQSGALLRMLEQFSVRGVNLSRIESRPSGSALGSYAFSIDIEGHVWEERIRAALIGLHRTCPEVKFLGSYPRVDGVRNEVREGTRDEDFEDARAWLGDILTVGDPNLLA